MSTIIRLPSISVCIATHKRPQQLAVLLDDLLAQTLRPSQVIVVDNDPTESARATVTEKANAHPELNWIYDTQAVKNISLTRNATMAHATGLWLAFVDDDERVRPDWLERLYETAVTHQADGVLAPVVPILPAHAPEWLQRGSFYENPRFPSGTIVPSNVLRIGNALLSSAYAKKHFFDPRYGLTGGEDLDFLLRLRHCGAVLVWSDEAIADEGVAEARMRLSWILKRALRGGQDFGRFYLMGRFGYVGFFQKLLFFFRSLLQTGVAFLLFLVCLPTGKSKSYQWLRKTAANLGKLSAYAGLHYKEYS
ncbi:MAG: glycosyltransferase family 2 protein [Pigmentiphaga sp.]